MPGVAFNQVPNGITNWLLYHLYILLVVAKDDVVQPMVASCEWMECRKWSVTSA